MSVLTKKKKTLVICEEGNKNAIGAIFSTIFWGTETS